MPSPIITLDKIHKIFHRQTVIDDVSLSVNDNEFLCLLGASGCGKTTLLNLIAGLTFPTSGTIFFRNKEITHKPARKRNFGIVFQNYALFPNLTVRKNIQYGLYNAKWTAHQRGKRVDTLLELIGLADHAQHYPNTLSGGQQQRVALARALAPNPNLLLLDEPLSALDAQTRVKLRNELRTMQRLLGITIIMVTHDQEEAMALSDRIAIINQGRIEQIGSPKQLYTEPKTPFVTQFIGSVNHITFPEWTLNNRDFFLRYEELSVIPATERNLETVNVVVARITHRQLMGPFYRLELLHSDQKTYFYADIPSQQYFDKGLENQELVAVYPSIGIDGLHKRAYNK